MSEEFREDIDDLEDKINANMNRIIDLEDKEMKIESYKIFLYPKTILNYISNLMNLQAKEDGYDQFYPANNSVISDLFKDKKVNPGNIQPNKIKYNPQINYKNLFKISEIISYQGWSGFNYLENLENNIDLNKPLILYYGIMQLGVFFSNLHFSFTPFNKTLSCFKNLSTHGIYHKEIKRIKFNFTVKSILSKEIQLKKMGVGTRFFLSYNSYLLKYFLKETQINLLDLLKNYFFQTDIKIKNQFQQAFGYIPPKNDFNSKMLSIYLISYYFSMLSRYKMHAWVMLLQDQTTNISYFIRYFLKFAKIEFINMLFEALNERRHEIPELTYMQSLF